MKIKAFYKKENQFLQSPMSDVQSPESVFCPKSSVQRGCPTIQKNAIFGKKWGIKNDYLASFR